MGKLIANLSRAICRGIALECDAIVVDRRETDGKVLVRGYGPSYAQRIFLLVLDTADDSFEIDQHPRSDAGSLAFADGTIIEYRLADMRRLLHVAPESPLVGHTHLEAAVAEYYQSPGMHVPQLMSVAERRRQLAEH
jgi:hypothetical protein